MSNQLKDDAWTRCLLMQGLVQNINDEKPANSEQLNEFSRMTPPEDTNDQLLLSQMESAAAENRPLDVLQCYERLVRDGFNDFRTYTVAKELAMGTMAAAERLSLTDPMNPELGRLYEMQLALGMTTITITMRAAGHYLMCGNQQRARELVGKLEKVCPNHPEVIALREALGQGGA